MGRTTRANIFSVYGHDHLVWVASKYVGLRSCHDRQVERQRGLYRKSSARPYVVMVEFVPLTAVGLCRSCRGTSRRKAWCSARSSGATHYARCSWGRWRRITAQNISWPVPWGSVLCWRQSRRWRPCTGARPRCVPTKCFKGCCKWAMRTECDRPTDRIKSIARQTFSHVGHNERSDIVIEGRRWGKIPS